MKKRKIVDAFIFSNELDMLEYRLELLYDKVDNFILVESNKTHAGDDKPLYFTIHKHKRFSKYLDKITHIIVTDFPRNLTQPEIDKLVAIPEIRNMNWVREHHQRRAISRGIEKLNLDYEDIIFVSDVDEIPDLDKIDDIINLLPYGPVVCQQRWFIWNVELEHPEDTWIGSTAFYYSHYLSNKDIFQHLRNIRWDNNVQFSSTLCGWHLSWFGNLEFIKSKIYSFAHTEVASDYFTYERNIKSLIENRLPPEKPTDDSYTLKKVTGGYLPPLPEKLKFFDVNDYPKRYDCVIFNDEIELLLLRLSENYEFYDQFVFIESRYTHTGEYKNELSFEIHKDLFAKYDEKVIYAVLEEFPETPEGLNEPIFRENYHRNSIKTVLENLEVKNQDYIFISNVDELIDGATLDSSIKEYEHIEYDYLSFKQRWMYWNFDYQHPEWEWFGTQIIRWDRLQKYEVEELRNNKDVKDYTLPNYRGWHLSWFGTYEQRENKRKYSSYYHSLENIETVIFDELIEEGKSLFGISLESTYQWSYFPKNKLFLETLLVDSQEQLDNDFMFDLE